MRDLEKLIEVFRPSDPRSDIAVIRMRRVMSLACVPFQQNLLSQAVCRKIHTFDSVHSLQERMRRLACKVLNDTDCYHIFYRFPSFRVVHDLAVCDRAVLPVDFPVSILVSCDDNAHRRKIALDALVFKRPHRTAQSEISKRVSFFIHRDSGRRRHS